MSARKDTASCCVYLTRSSLISSPIRESTDRCSLILSVSPGYPSAGWWRSQERFLNRSRYDVEHTHLLACIHRCRISWQRMKDTQEIQGEYLRGGCRSALSYYDHKRLCRSWFKPSSTNRCGPSQPHLGKSQSGWVYLIHQWQRRLRCRWENL